MESSKMLTWAVVFALLFLLYREMQRRAAFNMLKRMAGKATTAVADVANSFLKVLPGTNYSGGQRYGQRITGWGSAAKYDKTCDAACEQTNHGCVKHVVDPLTGRVEMVPCDPACCKCKRCSTFSDPSTGKAMCARGTHDNTIEPCNPECCFRQ